MEYNVSVNDAGLIRNFQMDIKPRNANLTVQNILQNCAPKSDSKFEVYKDADATELLNLCLEISRTEYEHSFRRAERLDNKIYILLTVCAFIFVVLISAIERGAGYSWALFCSNGWVFTYIVILLFCAIGTVVLLGALIYSLSGSAFKRYDSSLVLAYNMLSEDKKRVTRFTIMKYENAREHNNKIVTKRYRILNFCVGLLIVLVLALICITFLGNFMPVDVDASKEQMVIQEIEEEGDGSNRDVSRINYQQNVKGEQKMYKSSIPNDDQMWDLAGQDRPISREEIGIAASQSFDGLQELNEGFNFLQFNDQSKDIYKGTEDE